MALEGWSHVRIERGDPPAEVIADILGPAGSPAAFVLIAVDILISHWPKTLGVITPFLGAPELLSLDRTRQIHDAMPNMDIFGLGAIGPKEPSGPISRVSLEGRLSRRMPLEHLLGYFTHTDGADLEGLRDLLKISAERLGPPEPDDTFADSTLMAQYALNLTDKANWQPTDEGRAYVSPSDEARHVSGLQAKNALWTTDVNIDAAIQTSLENAAQSGPELAGEAVTYAKRLEALDTPEDEIRLRRNAVISAAMLAARDGSDTLLDEHENWVRDVFESVFASTDRDVGRSMRDGIRYNPVAIATLGLIHLWRRRHSAADRDLLLEIAGRQTDAAQGFGAGVRILREFEPRLIPAALRCALSAQIRPMRRWDDAEEKNSVDQARYEERISATIEAERAWLRGDSQEPPWPSFPAPVLHVRRGLRIGEYRERLPPPSEVRAHDEVYVQYASLWIRQLTRGCDQERPRFLPAFIDAYEDWTARANGAGYEDRIEIDERLHEWNRIFFYLLARTIPERTCEQASAAVARVIAVPDASFFDIAEKLVPALDELYFNDLGLDLPTALVLRGLIADRLVESAGWQHERERSEMSVEMRIGPAIGVMFFNNHTPFGGSRCYLTAKGVDRVDPYFPQIARLVEEGPVPFTTLLTMNLLEVSPQPKHAAFFVSSALTWLRRQPSNTSLWIESGLGERLARWLESVTSSDESLRSANHALRADMDHILARLVQIGVAEAHRVEQSLAQSLK